MAYAGLRAQPAQAPAAAAPMSIVGGMQLMGSGTRPIVTPVSQSVSGLAYSGVSVGGEPTFAQGFATSLGRNAVGIATGAAVGLGIAAAVPAAVLASPFVVGAGVGAAVLGAAYGGYRTGLAAYQGWTRNEVDPWTGAATGRTLTRAEQGAATGDFVAGGLTIGAGAAKAVASRFSAAPISGGLFRNKVNVGEFADLPVTMNLKTVRRMANEAEIGFSGIKINIVRDPSLKGRGVFGYAHPNGKQIDLYPDAFSSPDTLIRTLGHERTHIYQFKTFGPAKDSVMSGLFEDAAYGIEDAFILHWRRSR